MTKLCDNFKEIMKCQNQLHRRPSTEEIEAGTPYAQVWGRAMYQLAKDLGIDPFK